MILVQLILFCLLFTLLVKLGVGNNAVGGLYFYPKPVQERAFEIGLADREETAKKRKRFMIPFCLTMFVALILIVGLWNGAEDFKTAYLQSLLFLEVMNWYDGIVIDKVWVGYSRFWILPGTEDLPYIQTWGEVLKKRGVLTLVWVVLAVLPAGISVLIHWG